MTSSKDHPKERMMHELWSLEGRPPVKLEHLWENRREKYLLLEKGYRDSGEAKDNWTVC